MALLAALGAQFGFYSSMLQPALRGPDLEAARPAISRWVKTVLMFQTVIVVLTVAYVALEASHHPHGLAWTAPAVGAVVGTALPLQLAVMAIMRATRRQP